METNGSMDWFFGKNLQETMVFTMKYREIPVNFPIIQFHEWKHHMSYNMDTHYRNMEKT
jgi:hypothetical protein